MITKTYTYKIKPNKSLERKFSEQIGVCRYVYNLAIEVREESFRKGVSINYYNLSKQLTEAKKEFEWLRQVNAQSLQATLERLEAGYKKFFESLKKGVKTSKPKFARKDKWNSLPFKSIKVLENCFELPKFGRVKVFNFKVPKGELRTASIVKEADGLYLKVVVKQEEQIRENQSICAIDMGIAYFLATSDGEFIDCKIRPKSLQGIEDNNGWIRIESEEDLPKKGANCHFILKNGVCGIFVDIGDSEYLTLRNRGTHYQPIEEPLKPIY